MYTSPNIEDIFEKIKSTYGVYYHKLNGIDAERVASEAISEQRVVEQVELLTQYCGSLNGKKVLEVGSGYGMFVALTRARYGAYSYGIEPESEGFASSYKLSRDILSRYGLNPDFIKNSAGESMPFEDNVFDVVYSTNVLEHVDNPQAVLKESIRVLKPGGILQFVVPNYGSFWEGHYHLFWIPYINHWLARIYVKLFGRDPEYLNSLQFINYFTVRKFVRSARDRVEVLTYGEGVFKQRMESLNFSAWSGLAKLKKWLELIYRLRVIKIISFFMVLCKAHTPIILTLRKKK